MLKPRLIFTLLFSERHFNVSRNFNLQKVGDHFWLKNNYEFESISRSIDELIILNVNRVDDDFDFFCNQVSEIAKYSFMPLAVGGNIRTIEQADQLFKCGADKIVLNTSFFENEELIQLIISKYGLQAVVASVDFKKEGDDYYTFIKNGVLPTGLTLQQAVIKINEIGAGELYLTNIDRDGTGIGYDLRALEIAFDNCAMPIIAAGGADTYDKLVEGLNTQHVSGASTSHLFNFICDGLKDARELMIENGINLCKWNFNQV